MKRTMFAFAAAAALSLGGASVWAADVSPSWLNGSGGVNGGFTVNSSGTPQLGLRAIYRQNPIPLEPTGIDNTYTVVAGPQTQETSGNNGANAARAAWNYDFSINVGSGHTLNQYTALLTVTGPGGTGSVDPLLHWAADNTGYDGAKQSVADRSTSWVAQNSENLIFGDSPLPLGDYSLWTTGKYTFKLDLLESGSIIATDTINVNVVPVPLPKAAYAGLGLIAGLGLLGGLKRRQRKLA